MVLTKRSAASGDENGVVRFVKPCAVRNEDSRYEIDLIHGAGFLCPVKYKRAKPGTGIATSCVVLHECRRTSERRQGVVLLPFTVLP